MSERWELRLQDFKISRRRYLELLNFCLQYPEWRKELKFSTDTVKSPSLSGMPHSETNVTGDPTGDLAIRRAELTKRCELIEQAAIKAHPDDYQFLIWNVTQEGASYDFMYYYACENQKPIPRCSKREFYIARRLFFYTLDKAR